MPSFSTEFQIPEAANYVQQGSGRPVLLVHGVAASLHDWDELLPDLAAHGYACYALDLLGHGDSPKPETRAYHMDWVYGHFERWLGALQLAEPPIVIGHSLGGSLALEFARRHPDWTRGLVLVSPFYSRSQLHFLLRHTYGHQNLSGLIASRTPEWMFRLIVDLTSGALGHSIGGSHALPERIRAQTALDYTRTAPGVYNLPNTLSEWTDGWDGFRVPSLVVWGERDQALAPDSFPKLVAGLPGARGKSLRAGHVPHQSHAAEFNPLVLEFLNGLA